MLQLAPVQLSPDSVQVPADTLGVNPMSGPAITDWSDVPFDSAVGLVTDYLSSGEFEQAGELIFHEVSFAVTAFAPKLFVAFLLLLFLYAVYRVFYRLLRGFLKRTRYIRPGLETLVLQGFRLVCLMGIGITSLQSLGIDPAALVAGIGVAGIALGIAARDTVENIISGASILADGSFKIGDVVIFNQTYCEVKEITLRTTRLRTPRNETLIVPNRQMANDPLLNHTVGGNLRIEIPFSIAYKEFPQQARDLVLKLTDGDSRLAASAAPEVKVSALNESSIDMMLWVYVSDPSREREIIYDYAERIREALREANIEIPFPHLQVMIEK